VVGGESSGSKGAGMASLSLVAVSIGNGIKSLSLIVFPYQSLLLLHDLHTPP
jgi:hypothetical protein